MPSTVGLPSASTFSHIISGSQPARRCMPVSDSNSAWSRLRFPRQSEVRKAPPSTSSSRPRNSVQKMRAVFVSHGRTQNVSGSGMPTSSRASGP